MDTPGVSAGYPRVSNAASFWFGGISTVGSCTCGTPDLPAVYRNIDHLFSKELNLFSQQVELNNHSSFL